MTKIVLLLGPHEELILMNMVREIGTTRARLLRLMINIVWKMYKAHTLSRLLLKKALQWVP